MRKNEGLLYLGRWTSKVGNIIFDYASNISLVSFFGAKPWVLALYQSSETIVQIFFNLIGGVKADFGNRKKILIVTDIAAAVVCLLASFFVKSDMVGIALVIANSLLAFVYAFNSPTYKAIVRDMIEQKRVIKYNSISNAGSDVVNIVGPIIGLMLVGVIGVRGALLFNAGTFFVSAIAEVFLSSPKINDTKTAKTKTAKSFFKEIGLGFKYLISEKQIFLLIIISALVNFFLAGHNLLLPYTDVMYHGFFTGFYGKSLTAEAIGGIAGAFITAKLSSKKSINPRILVLLLMGTGAALVLVPCVSGVQHIIICLAPFFIFGLFLTMFNIHFMSYIQIHVDDNYLGRIFSIIFTVAVLFMPVGSFIFSLLGNIASIYNFMIVGAGILLLSVVSIFFVKRVS